MPEISIPSQNQTFVTVSHWCDLVIFLLLVGLIIVTSYRLRVYFRVTVVEVSLIRIAPNGIRQVLPTPKQFRRMWSATEPTRVALDLLERNINEYMYKSSLLSHAEPGTRFDWLIRYAFNSTLLDKQLVLVFETDESHRF